jgi:hypothetical protein
MASPVGDVASGFGQFSRYFGVVNTASSTTLVVFTIGLLASGALQGQPELSALAASLTDTSLADVGLLALATIVVSLLLHPFQYALVQALEGYWGPRRWAIAAMDTWAQNHVRRHIQLSAQKAQAVAALGRIETVRNTLDHLAPIPKGLDITRLDSQRRRILYKQQETQRLLDKYPSRQRIMPTTLGNRLRQAEDQAGRAWGLDAIAVLPHLNLLAEEPEKEYMEATVSDLDASVRFCLVWSIATVIGVVLLWSDGWWLLLPLATYVLAHLSYRGATVSAGEHGAAITSLVDLTRFTLYERLGLARPASTALERHQNRVLMRLLEGATEPSVSYRPDP